MTKREAETSMSSAEAHSPALVKPEPVDTSAVKSAPLGCPALRGVTTTRSSRLSLVRSPTRKRDAAMSTSSEKLHAPALASFAPSEVRTV